MKYYIAAVVAVLVGVAIYGAYLYPKPFITAGSAQGSTFSNAKFYGAVANLAAPGANATSTSILNTDGSARYISGFRIGCTGVGTSQTAYTGAGLASWQVTIGTSTTAAPANFVGAANVANSFVLGTSTVNLIVASSTTQTASSSLAMLWPAGAYLTFFFNATNTAICTVGADTIGS